jgi:hypothetical protein
MKKISTRNEPGCRGAGKSGNVVNMKVKAKGVNGKVDAPQQVFAARSGM